MTRSSTSILAEERPVEEGHVFGPDTVTWRVHADPLLGVAGLRALALRALSPSGLAAVSAGSRGFLDPWDGLARAMRYVGVMTFGSTVEAIMAAARIRALHAQIELDDDGGTVHDDDGAVLWAHVCQVSSFLEVVRRGGLALSPGEQDEYLREQVRTAAMLGLDPGVVPCSRSEVERYFRAARARLAVTPEARGFVTRFSTESLPGSMALLDRHRPSWAPVAGLAFAALPSWARRIYDMPYRSGSAALRPAATTVALHALRDSLLVGSR